MAAMSADRQLEERMIAWARDAGETALAFERGPGTVKYKAGREAVTDADTAIETMLRRRIAEVYPEDAVVGEEQGASANTPSARRVWHIDPIDGTLNYAQGLPDFCISLAVYEDGVPLGACIHQPVGGEFWSAFRGGGTRRNGAPATVSGCPRLDEAIIAAQVRKRGRLGRHPDMLQALVLGVHKWRKVGAIALEMAWTSSGSFDGLVIASRGAIPFHDVAAGMLLITEAGGVVTDGEGQPFREGSHELVAGGAAVHLGLLGLLAARPQTDS